MMFQDTFIVPAELWLFIIGKRVAKMFMTKSSQFIEYMKIHLISLNQDLEDARNNEPLNEDEYYESDSFYMGAIDATEHLLSVATDIMNDDLQGKGY
jgi:hypothetical protein